MKISVYWPTRKRSQSLMISMSSYIMNADNNHNIEYINSDITNLNSSILKKELHELVNAGLSLSSLSF